MPAPPPLMLNLETLTKVTMPSLPPLNITRFFCRRCLMRPPTEGTQLCEFCQKMPEQEKRNTDALDFLLVVGFIALPLLLSLLIIKCG